MIRIYDLLNSEYAIKLSDGEKLVNEVKRLGLESFNLDFEKMQVVSVVLLYPLFIYFFEERKMSLQCVIGNSKLINANNEITNLFTNLLAVAETWDKE